MRVLKGATRIAAAASVVMLFGLQTAHADPTSILFVGNSFTYGDAAGGPNLVRPFGAGTVTDLNGTGVGGVPALFKAFTLQKGLSYNVKLETQPGVGVDWHYNNRLGLIAQPWDKVVLQSYSTLNGSHPGDPSTLIQYSGLLANALHAQNAGVQIYLNATWSRADQTYLPTGHWYGQPIDAMQRDVEAGYRAAAANSPLIGDGDVIQTGAAWNRAIETGLADSNPYDGIMPGKLDLWAPDNYHGSVFGYYLEALMLFGDITGLDPLSLGGSEYAALALGITSRQAIALQQIAHDQLAAAVPEPSSLALLVVACLGVVYARRRAQLG
jgi:hypothetical protein